MDCSTAPLIPIAADVHPPTNALLPLGSLLNRVAAYHLMTVARARVTAKGLGCRWMQRMQWGPMLMFDIL